MKPIVTSIINKIHPATWIIACYIISILMFSLILANRQPGILREISIASRIDFIPIIPIISVILYFCHRVPGRIGGLISLTATMSLFALPLAGLWASGHTHTTALSGVIPLADAQGYYIDALRLTNGMDFSIFAARRPFYAGLLAVLLSITNYNLMISLAIFTILVGLSAYLTAKEIEKTNGTEVSVFVLIMVFMYYRLHGGINMTENLGVILGLFGFSALWNGAANKRPWLIYFGLFVTSLALNARAGALFTLPFFVIWAGWIFRDKNRINWKVTLISLCAAALGFICDLLLTKWISTPGSIPFSNFAYSFYGLASGGNSWAYIYEAHPEVFSLPAHEQTGRIYQLALELIKNKPSLIIQGALFNWKVLFSDTLYSLYSYVAHENWEINPFVKWSLYITSLLGLYACTRNVNDSLKSFVLAGALGVFLSIPFAQTIDAFRMRPYAASVASMVIIPSIGIDFLLKQTKIFLPMKLPENKSRPISIVLISSIVISLMLLGPIIIKQIAKKRFDTVSTSSLCGQSLTPIIIRLDKGTSINLYDKSIKFTDWAPDFHIKNFQKESHSLSNSDMIAWAQTVPSSSTLLMTIDRITGSGILIIMPIQFTQNTTGRYFQLCGQYENNKPLSNFIKIFYAEKIENLTEPGN